MNVKKLTRKLMSMFLAAVMLFTNIGVTVFAEEESVLETEVLEEQEPERESLTQEETEETVETAKESVETEKNGTEEAEEECSETQIDDHDAEKADDAEETGGDSNESTIAEEENGVEMSDTWGGITWSIDADGKLTVTGTGDFLSGGETDAPWYEYREEIISAEVNVSDMTYAQYMFNGCSNMKSVDLKNLDTSRITYMKGMFKGCSSLEYLDLSNFNTGRVIQMNDLFRECSSLKNITFGEQFDTSNVTSIGAMFRGCSSLTSLDLSRFDTGNATGMNGMFWGCSSLTGLDLSSFNTKNVEDMNNMFKDCTNLSVIDLSSFHTQSATKMNSMFSGCSSLTSLDLSTFDVRNVTTMELIFNTCDALTEIYAPYHVSISVVLPEGTWYDGAENTYTELPMGKDCSVVLAKDKKPEIAARIRAEKAESTYYVGENISLDDLVVTYYSADGMVRNLESSEYATNVEEIDTSVIGEKTLIITYNNGTENLTAEVKLKVVYIGGSYWDITWSIDADGKLMVTGEGNFSYEGGETDAPWYGYREKIISAEVNVSGMTNSQYMFNGCSNMKSVDLKNFDTSRITSMKGMFMGCSSLESVDMSNFDTRRTQKMHHLFRGCSNLKSVTFGSLFDTTEVTDIGSMFRDCNSLTDIDVSNFNTAKVVSMNSMFSGCSGLTSLGLRNFNTENVEDMNNMFKDCTNLSVIDVSSFHTQSATKMNFMFKGCSSLTSLDLSGFDTTNVTTMISTFHGCSSLTSLDLSSFDVSNVTTMETIFDSCDALMEIYAPYHVSVSAILPEGTWYDSAGKTYTELPTGKDYSVLLAKDKKPEITARIKAAKAERTYYVGENISLDDLVVTYYSADGTARNLESSEYTTNVEEIDTSVIGEKTLIITYNNGTEALTAEVILNVIYIGGTVGAVTWSIDENGKLTVTGTGDFMPSYAYYSDVPWYENREEILSAEIDLTGVTNADYMFYGCDNLNSVDFKNFDTSRITNMSYMFGLCNNLTNIDLSSFDMTRVTNADNMFSYCDALTTIKTPKNLSVSVPLPSTSATGWYDADGNKYTELPKGKSSSILLTQKENITWDIDENGKLTVTGEGDFLPSYAYYSDVPWYERRGEILSAEIDLTGVTNTRYMFYGCYNLNSIVFKNFDTSQITDMGYMFYDCDQLTNLDLSSFDTGNVTDMSYMFDDCYRLTDLDLSSFNTEKVTNMRYMFRYCSSLMNLDLSSFNMSSVTDAEGMFSSCSSLSKINTPRNAPESIALSSDENVTWYDAEGNTYTALPTGRNDSILLKQKISGTDNDITWSIEDGKLLVEGTGDYSSWYPLWTDYYTRIQTAEIKVQNMTVTRGMFYYCQNLTSVDFSGFDASHVTDMNNMFYYCQNLTSVDFSGFDASHVTNMRNMFYNCQNLTSVDFSGFDASHVTDISNMFYNCWSLTEVDLSGFNGGSMGDLFRGCNALTTIRTPRNVSDSVELPMGAWCDTDGNAYTELPTKKSESILLTKKEAQEADSGTYKGITWSIDADGKLLVEGTGDFSDDTSATRAPWYGSRAKIKTAKIKVTGMTNASYMFFGCTEMTEVDLSELDTAQVTNMDYMFGYCGTIDSLELSSFKTSKVTTAKHMFYNCSSMTSLNLKSIDFGAVTDMSYMFYNCNDINHIDLSGFKTSKASDMSYMFYRCYFLRNLDLSSFNTENVTNMNSMFFECTELTNLNLSNFETKNVTNMSNMFSGCYELTDLNLDSFDTANVTNMNSMFYECVQLTNLNLSNFETKNVTDMSNMFGECYELTDLNLDSFDTANVTNMNSMFYDCRSLAKLDLSSFDTVHVTDMSYMFYNCQWLSALDLSSFNTENVTDMSYMFWWCEKLEDLNVSSFNTENVTDMSYMFAYCEELTSLDLSNFNAVNVTMIDDMLARCDNLIEIRTPYNVSGYVQLPGEDVVVWYDSEDHVYTELPTGKRDSMLLTGKRNRETVSGTYKGINWSIDENGKLLVEGTGDFAAPMEPMDNDYEEGLREESPWQRYSWKIETAEVKVQGMTDASHMFIECGNLRSVDLSGFDTSSVTNMQMMFEGCYRLKSLDLSSFNTENVTDMSGMFYNCESLLELDLSSFNTGNVTNMRGMFEDCIGLRKLELGSFRTENVTNMYGMFYNCQRLIELDLSDFRTEKVTIMNHMFDSCQRLTELDLSSFNTEKVTEMNRMFSACERLTKLDLSSFNTEKVTDMHRMFEDCRRLERLNLSGFNMTNVIFGDISLQECRALTTIYTPLYLSQTVGLPDWDGGWYDIEGNYYDYLPKDKSTSVLLARGKKPDVTSYITATKRKTIYEIGDTINTDDLQVKYYAIDGSGRQLENTEYTTNAAAIDTQTAGEKILTITYQNGTEVLTADIKLTVIKNEESDIDKDDSPYTDDERTDLKSVNAEIAKIKAKVYDQYAYEPVVKVTATVDGKKTTLTEGADYRVLYKNNINAGTGTVIVRGNGIYKGEIDTDFTISPKPVKKLKVLTGNLAGDVSESDFLKLPVYVYDGTKLLECNKDYILSEYKTIKPTTSQITVTAVENGNYTGSVVAKFSVYESGAKVLNPENIKLDKEIVPYTGKAIKDVEPIVTVNDTALTKGKDYKVQYQNNKDAGTAFVIVTGKGEYKGKVVVPFTIKAEEAPLTVVVKNAKAFSGKLQKPAVTVTVTKDGKAKKLGKKDYTVAYKDNFHAGTATVTVTGKGNYAGLKQTATFIIKQQEIKKVSVKGTQENLVLTYSKQKLKEGTDYTIQYGETNKNKIAVTIKGTDTGDFTGEVTKYVKTK